MWGFYPDERNPHRVGFSSVPVAAEMFTYWIEPRWMAGYLCMLAAAARVPGDTPPRPCPPAELVVPAGFGTPDDWDDDRHASAKLECWELTSHGWGVARRRLLGRD